LGEPHRAGLLRHAGKDTIARVSFLRRILGKGDDETREESARAPSKEEALGAYIIREHRQGRPIDAILDDPYLKNRTSDEQRARLLERPEVIRAIGEDTAAMAKDRL
jgi:hypothetical protein